MFHHFHGPRPAHGQGSITAGQFAELLDFVGPGRILPAREWLRRALDDALGPDDVCLTFDDNLRCQFELALPVLREADLTGFWFIPTAVLEGRHERLEIDRAFRVCCYPGVEAFYGEFERFVLGSPHAALVEQGLAEFDPQRYLAEFAFYSEGDRRFRYLRDRVLGSQRYGEVMDALMAAKGVDADALAAGLWMDAAHIRQLHAEGHVIGLHSHTHPTCLADLPVAAQREEYARNHACLTELLGAPPTTMSHPCNSYGPETLAILRDLGVRLGFRSNAALRAYTALEWPREDHTSVLRRMRGAPTGGMGVTAP